MTKLRTVLDVSELPEAVMDHRSPIWWGNVLLLVIETAMFAILLACYFYFRQNFSQWPPPKVTDFPHILNPDPRVSAATINTLLLVLSCIPMALVDLACIRRHQLSVAIGLVICIACGVAAAGLRFVEFSDLLFKWNENAYASVIWTTLGIHLAHIITGTCENLLMLSWIVLKDMDVKHARDVRVAAFYWYWIAGIWLPIYAIVYWGPRLF